jgi:hypothetical protein
MLALLVLVIDGSEMTGVSLTDNPLRMVLLKGDDAVKIPKADPVESYTPGAP